MRQRPANESEPELPTLMRSLAQHLAPPGAQVYQTLVDHAEAQQRVDRVVDLHLRHAAHQSYAAAPPAFSEAVRKSLAEASIAPAAPHPARDVTIPNQLGGGAASSARGWRRSVQLTERQWRAALGGIGTLALAVIFGGVSVALDPSEVFSVLGMLSAVLLSALTVGHMLSTAVGAIMSSALLGCLAIALYAALCVLWVRLVRRPVEA